MLERMRLLDSMHRLAIGSMATYKSGLRRIREFERDYDLSILRPTPLEAPSSSPVVPLAWTQLRHTLRKGRGHAGNDRIKFGTSRGLRSAASAWFEWDLMMSRPGEAWIERTERQGRAIDRVLPTAELSYTYVSAGMKRRMGNSSRPSYALRWRHIKFLDDQYRQQFLLSTTDAMKHEAAAAGTANLLFWLGWLRGGEGFGLQRTDIQVTRPEVGHQKGLPRGLGMVELRLLPETKSSPGKTADVLISYFTGSGLCLGWWVEKLLFFSPEDGTSLFSTPSCTQWSSGYFRRRHVYPHLEILKAWDPDLSQLGDGADQQLGVIIFSMHSWRRGADTFVHQLWPGINLRVATKEEIYEHARWKLKKAGSREDMHVHYREWNREERIRITFLCM